MDADSDAEGVWDSQGTVVTRLENGVESPQPGERASKVVQHADAVDKVEGAEAERRNLEH